QVEYAAEGLLADRRGNRAAGVDRFHAAHQPIRRAEGHTAHAIAAQMLLHLTDEMNGDALVIGVDSEGIVDLRQVPFFELRVKRRADDLYDLADLLLGGSGLSVSGNGHEKLQNLLLGTLWKNASLSQRNPR